MTKLTKKDIQKKCLDVLKKRGGLNVEKCEFDKLSFSLSNGKRKISFELS